MRKSFLILVGLCLASQLYANPEVAEETDPPQIAIGERLTFETRFAQAYYANPGQADPALEKTVTRGGELRGPFAGKTMNCRTCHLIDEHVDNPAAGMRSYSDYASRSPVPAREDGAATSARNAMTMVNIALPREHGPLFHYDGEFNSIEDLVRATLTGRNFGWLPGERDQAIKHLADVIRNDDGKGKLAAEFGGSYRKVLTGTASDIPDALRLPSEYRVEVDKASDQQLFDAVAKIIGAYVNNLAFATDEQGTYIGSPYDAFLQKNKLPAQPARGESLKAYNQRLLKEINQLDKPVFVDNKDGKFASHQQDFIFGQQELAGLKLFFRAGNAGAGQSGGNCASCHTAPHFTDFAFHNTGLTQHNYDQLHGNGAFNQLAIPGLAKRNANHEAYLPATAIHPRASSRFRSIPRRDKPGYTDLGLWNVFANPDMPNPQDKLTAILCQQAKSRDVSPCNQASLLDLSIAAFKTPGLRDLGHANPYMHTGQFDGLQQSVGFYLTSSALAKSGQLRNADPALQAIKLSADDIEPLVAFLKSLNEDYD